MTVTQAVERGGGKRFEDFRLGDNVVTPGRTVGIEEISRFSGLAGNYYPLHTDVTSVEAGRFGQRLCHGSLTFSLAHGLANLTGFLPDDFQAPSQARGIKALRPVFPGDTIRVKVEVTMLTVLSAAEGSVGARYCVSNQRGEDVMTFERDIVLPRADGRG